MNKNSIVFFVLCNLVSQQHSAFHVSSKLLQPAISAFSESFLRVAQHNAYLLKSVHFFSQAPLEKPVENQLFRLRCEDGVDIKVGVMQSVFNSQKELFKELQAEGALIDVLPEDFQYLDWQQMCDDNAEWTGRVKFVQNYEYDSVITAALFSYYTANSRVALFGRENESLTIHECSSTKKNLDALQEDFRSWLEKNKK